MNKQIEEIAKLICTYPHCMHYNIIGACANTECHTVDIAENLYNNGYRKASQDGAECPTCHGTGRIGTTDWLTKNISKEQLAKEKAEAVAEHEAQFKRNVAREIINEIDDALHKMATEHVDAGHPIYFAICEMVHHKVIRPIEKKYTEDE